MQNFQRNPTPQGTGWETVFRVLWVLAGIGAAYSLVFTFTTGKGVPPPLDVVEGVLLLCAATIAVFLGHRGKAMWTIIVAGIWLAALISYNLAH